MWSIDQPFETANSGSKISLETVLYSYDGPQIFTGLIGFVRALFIKFEELDQTDLFLATPIDDGILEYLVEGRLSVRGAISTETSWIVEAQPGLTVGRYWTCSFSDLPEDILPESGLGLFSHFGIVADSVAQSEAFFAVKFRSKVMTSKGMPFGTFKALVDKALDASRSILSPLALAGTKTSTFDFLVSEPQFASLVIALQSPLLNSRNVKRHLRDSDTDMASVEAEIDSNRANFFVEMREVVEAARKDGIPVSIARDKFHLLDRINTIIPSERNAIDSVDFSGSFSGSAQIIHIDAKTGDKISKAHQVATSSTVREVGIIDVVNAPSSYIVIYSTRGKQVTCYLSGDAFSELDRTGLLKHGSKIELYGRLGRRQRRDLLTVEGVPRFLPKAVF